MLHASSTARLALPPDRPVDDSAATVGDRPTLDANEFGSRIRARRVLPAPIHDVLAAWTTPSAWGSWMRLRSKCRATIAPRSGSAFRLEIAEGPTIHVITGEVIDISSEHLVLSWCHHERSETHSTITVVLRDNGSSATDVVFVHDHIANRREAAWLMRFWATALKRLDDHVSRANSRTTRRSDVALSVTSSVDASYRPLRPTTFARSA